MTQALVTVVVPLAQAAPVKPATVPFALGQKGAAATVDVGAAEVEVLSGHRHRHHHPLRLRPLLTSRHSST